MEDKYKNFDPKDLKFCPYQILELEPPTFTSDDTNSTQVKSQLPESEYKKQVQSKYRKLALKYHPDRHPDDKEKHQMFLWLKEASEILNNQRAKTIYDRHLHSRHINKGRLEK